MQKLNTFTLIIVTLLMSTLSIAQPVPNLHKGVSLSNWFWNQTKPFDAETWITKQDYDWIKNQGYDHVRIPVDMQQLDQDWLIPKLRQAIQWGVDIDLVVIISCFGDEYNTQLIPQERYHQKLGQLAKIIAAFPKDKVLFQFANEPDVPDPKTWSRIQSEMILEVRKYLPDRWILTSTPLRWRQIDGWDQIKAFSLMTPSADQQVIYTLYFYEPFFFTHQGASWSGNEAKHVKGHRYPSNALTSQTVISSLPKDLPEWLPQTLAEGWEKNRLAEKLKPIIAWRDSFKRPIMISEIGVHRPYAPKESTQNWLKDVQSLLDHHQIPYTLWDYRGNFSIRWDDPNFVIPKDSYN